MQLINHLTLHAKGCLRKLDAVQEMLKAQEDQHDNDGASGDSGDFDDDGELPFRDVEKPKRIIEVVYGKALELETTINERLGDLNSAGDAAQAAKQVLLSVAVPHSCCCGNIALVAEHLIKPDNHHFELRKCRLFLACFVFRGCCSIVSFSVSREAGFFPAASRMCRSTPSAHSRMPSNCMNMGRLVGL